MDGRVNVTDLSRAWAQRDHDARFIAEPTITAVLAAARAVEPLSPVMATSTAFQPAPLTTPEIARPAGPTTGTKLASPVISTKLADRLFAEWSGWLAASVRMTADLDELADRMLQYGSTRRRIAGFWTVEQRFSW